MGPFQLSLSIEDFWFPFSQVFQMLTAIRFNVGLLDMNLWDLIIVVIAFNVVTTVLINLFMNW